MSFQNGIEAGLAYAREALTARMAKPEREPETEATLALAILALLAAREAESKDSANEPGIINFERAKSELLPRRTHRATSAPRRRRLDSDRPRLKIFRGE